MARVSETFWSVVLTHSNAEIMALRHLERQKFEVFFPFYLTKSKRGRDLVKALFPSYMFVHLDEDTHWSPINSTYGVRRLLCYESDGSPYREPHRLGEGFVENLRAMRLSPSLGRGPNLQSGTKSHRPRCASYDAVRSSRRSASPSSSRRAGSRY
jgi:hypothetical protein